MKVVRLCQVVEISTPKKYVLNGLWFGPKRPKRVIIWVHGMFSSAFSMRHVVSGLVTTDTAVLTFSNRGSETVTDVKQIMGNKRRYVRAGTAHEIFVDSTDDISGAIAHAKKSGATSVILAGHSTGCQKIVYYAYRSSAKGIAGLLLLGPLSDYTDAMKNPNTKAAVALARKKIMAGKPHELLPASTWWHYTDAQRFLSLYTPDSIEQSIFPYFDEKRVSKAFSSIKIPILSLFAGADEYADRPAGDIARWFRVHNSMCVTATIPNTGHSFRGGENTVARLIRGWMKRCF